MIAINRIIVRYAHIIATKVALVFMLYKSKLDSSKLTMTAFSFLLYTPLQE